jgi:hypothetical protein
MLRLNSRKNLNGRHLSLWMRRINSSCSKSSKNRTLSKTNNLIQILVEMKILLFKMMKKNKKIFTSNKIMTQVLLMLLTSTITRVEVVSSKKALHKNYQ